ncbi:hypothetical protein SAMN04488120_10328 [Fontimonas thermophila]|uniref:Ferric reductase like transmembrane component n=1 Tax=Fontimonas thermophila TaxID=1076937 RepID=A0A1I2I8N9_9GAMM|nr:hypothetical protein [Fontimonas thermophila]SFF37246.1 hypothetical protein SAMN04488120_10328 [Fontimonas thermophila]
MRTAAPSKRIDEPIHSGFLQYAGYRWAKLAILLCALSIAAYLWHDPVDGPNGGTWLGYTLGTLGAVLILWLTWLGVRKRRYHSRLGSVKGWTSAHVYLGLALVVIATLHCGFQFGWNIHTAAYALMMAVIASGLYGVVVYTRLPSAITRLRDGSQREAWIDEVFELNAQAIRIADLLGPEVHRKIVRSAENIRIGGGLRAQLYGPKTPKTAADADAGITEFLTERLDAVKARLTKGFDPNATAQNTVMFMAGQLVAAGKDEKEAQRLQQLLDVLSRRNALIARINRDIALHARLQVWLLIHVPLSFGLLAALVAHIVSVFFYW